MLSYLLQMIACSAILYAYYHLFLRNEKFHAYNRFYLLSIVVLSLLLPLSKIPVYFTDDNPNDKIYQSFGELQNIVVIAGKAPFTFDAGIIAILIYLTIALYFMAKIILAVTNIYRLKRNSETEEINDILFIKTNHPDTPFSFFKWLFWNKKIALHTENGQQIFKHEIYHIRNAHSYDIIFLEIVVALFWFNPVCYLIRNELKTIQEFLSDKYATQNQDKNQYAELLLMQRLGNYQHKLVNPFFHNQLKRRIIMLTSSKKPAHQYLRKLMVLPLVATAIILFAFTYKKDIKTIVAEKTKNIETLFTPAEVDFNTTNAAPNELKEIREIRDTVPVKKGKTDTIKIVHDEEVFANSLNEVVVVGYGAIEDSTAAHSKEELYTKVEVEAAYPGGSASWRNFLERNINPDVPVKNGAPAGTYRVSLQFRIDKDGNIDRIKPLSAIGYGMEEEVIRVLNKSAKWAPAIVNGRKVITYRTQPFVFQVMSASPKTAAPINQTKPNPEPEIFTKVEVEAAYPGGYVAWRNFLQTNLRADVGQKNGAPAGTYTALIQFIVDINGNVSDVKAVSKNGYGMEEEAMRVISKSGKWTPAMQNKRYVKAYRKQPITFVLQQENKKS